MADELKQYTVWRSTTTSESCIIEATSPEAAGLRATSEEMPWEFHEIEKEFINVCLGNEQDGWGPWLWTNNPYREIYDEQYNT
jgi:hypothetical protein